MTAMDIIRQYENSRKLPIGHYDRKKAEVALEKEYRECSKIEIRYYKYQVSLDQAQKLCRDICVALGVRKIPECMVDEKMCPYIGGYQKGRFLCFPRPIISLATVIHELTHYIMYRENLGYGHGKEFCYWLKFLFQVLEEIKWS